MKNHFFKGHGLGNDYIALDPAKLSFKLTPRIIRTLCDRNWGIGSDGILALTPSKKRILDYGFIIQMAVRQKSQETVYVFLVVISTTQNTQGKNTLPLKPRVD